MPVQRFGNLAKLFLFFVSIPTGVGGSNWRVKDVILIVQKRALPM
jgi:hypothetical protein